MAKTRPLPQRQDWLIKRMKRLGYHANISGVCYGLAHMGMQAILARDIKTFNTRLQQIYDIINVQESLRQLHKRQEALREQGVSDFADRLDLTCLFRNTPAARQKKPSRRVLKPVIPQQWIDIFAFFDGVELYQNTEYYPQLFSKKSAPYVQSAEKTLQLVTPVTLAEQGGVAAANKFSGIYTIAELHIFFSLLKSSLSSFEHPAAFVFSNSNHAITVGFDPEQDLWIFIDANQPPAIYLNEDEIGKRVKSAFACSKYTALSMQAYGLQQDQAELTACLLQLSSNQTWQMIHTPTAEKTKRTDDEKATWLYIAADNGLTNTVYELLRLGADPDQACSDGFTPIYIAAQNGHAAVVEALLRNNADPSILFDKTYSPLYIAAHYNYIDVVRVLLSNGARPDPGGKSPLEIATKMGHTEIVRLLVDRKSVV